MHTEIAEQYLRIGEAAALIHVHPDTLRRSADRGEVAFIRTPGGERRFLRADLDALMSGGRR